MEILAPAGNFEAFFAALEKGADAVYVGLKSFNARAYARNFSLEELSYMVPYAHKQKKKVFVALNSVIKESEIPELIDTAIALGQIKPDALIIQDLGVFFLLKKRFPHLRLHASTLMTAHNLAGVKKLAEMGFKRIVLARELTLEEIAHIRQEVKAELEVFVHGALCFTYSGLCLASSYLGGQSSVRGRCRQPCRFLYRCGEEKGYFLSCNDLCALELIPRLKEIGIDSVKIEGRMKSAEYVAAVVEAYRLVRDANPKELPAAINYARSLLEKAGGRRISFGFFLLSHPKDVLDPTAPSAFGVFVGRVLKKEENKVYFLPEAEVEIGDRIRAQSESLGKGVSWKVKMIERIDNLMAINAPEAVEPGYLLFRVVSKTTGVKKSDKKLKEQLKKEITPLEFKLRSSESKRLKQWVRVQALSLPQKLPSKSSWWIRHEQVEFFLDHSLPSGSIPVLSLNIHSYPPLMHHVRRLQKRLPLLTLHLPPIILPSQLAFYQKAITQLMQMGFKRWHLSNIGHLYLLPQSKDLILSVDYTFNLANHLALRILKEMGIKYLTLSVEMDKITLREITKFWMPKDLIVMVFGRVPLFTSRLQLGCKECLISPLGEKYYPLLRDEITYILPEEPFSLGQYIEELERFGIRNFLIDIRFLLNKQIRRLVTARRVNLARGFSFNYKREWK